MQVFEEIKPLRAHLKPFRGEAIGLVPTMGALHEGHLTLVRQAKQECPLVVASIYVNPTQFNNPADLAKYPRTLERDLDFLHRAGCDVVFAPANDEMYAQPSRVRMDWGHLDSILEGKFRPGHFSGVSLVVSKLFNIVQPTVAYFGQKDYQQFCVITQLAEEFKFDVQLKCVETVREPDGLAMSSRNIRLNKQQRQQALVFYQSLQQAHSLIQSKYTMDQVRLQVTKSFSPDSGVSLEYLELADRENLILANGVTGKPQILLIAGYVGEVRLIDNLLI